MSHLKIHPPGKPGIFYVDPYKDWETRYSPTHLKRELRLINEIKNSIFSSFTLLGYDDGTIRFSVEFFPKSKSEKLKAYLLSIDSSGKLSKALLKINRGEKYILISDLDLIKKMFNNISAFNKIPKKELTLMREIIKAGDWKKITPYTKQEEQKIESGYVEHQNTWGSWRKARIKALQLNPLSLSLNNVSS